MAGTVKLGLQLDRQSVDQFKAAIAQEVKSIPPIKVKVEAEGGDAASKAFRDTSKAADDLFRTVSKLTQQRVKEALKEQAIAAREKAQADKDAAKQADELFRTNARLSQQRISEELKSQAKAARDKAIADRDAAREADALFRTNARLTAQKVREELQGQAKAAKEKADADRAAAAAAAQLAREQEKFEKAFNTAAIQQQVEQAERLRQGYQALAAGAGAVSAAVGGIFTKGIGDFTDFERSIKTIGVTTEQVGTQQLKDLTDEITRLGIETSKTPQEIAKATIELTRAGFGAEQAKEAIGGIVQASEATGSSLSTVSDIITKTINQFGLSASDSQRVADVLVKAANSTNTSVESLGQSLKFVGPAAKASNQSLEETVALLGLLGDAGLQGGQGGRNLSTALERLKIASAAANSEGGLEGLVKGSKRAAESLKILGLQVRNSDGSVKSLAGLLPELRQQLNTLSKGDQDIVLKTLFGVEGGRAVVALLGQSDEKIRAVVDSTNKAAGASAKASQLLKEGLSGAFDLLDGSIGAASVKIGEFVAVGLEPLVRGATAVVNGFLALPAPIQATVIGLTGLTGAIAGAVAILAVYKALQIDTALANAALAIQQGIASAAQAKQTVVTAAQTVAQTALNLVTKEFTVAQIQEAIATGVSAAQKQLATLWTNALAAAEGALAIATGKADAATLAKAANLGKLVVAAGLAAAAVGTVVVAASRFSDGGKEFNDSAAKIEKKLIDLQIESGKTREAIKSAIPDEPPPTDFVDGIVAFGNKIDDPIAKLFGFDKTLLDVTTNAEKRVNDAKLGVDNFRGSIVQLTEEARRVGSGFQEGVEPSTEQLKQAKQVQEAFTLAVQETEARLQGLDPNKLGKKAYEELKNQLEVTKAELLSTQAAFNKTITPSDAGKKGGASLSNIAFAPEPTISDKEKRKQVQEAFQDLTAIEKQAQASEDRQTAIVKRALLDRTVSREEGQKRLLAAEINGTQSRLDAVKRAQGKLDELEKSGTISKQDADQKRADLAKKQADLEKQLIEQRLRAQEEADKRAVASFEQANQKRLSLIESAQTKELTALKARQLEGALGEKDAAIESQAIAARNAAEVLKAKEAELKGLQALRNRFSDPKEFAQKELSAQREVEQARLRSLEQSLATERAKRERAIELRLAQEKNATQQIVQGYQRQANALDFLVKREELVAKFNEARINREKAGSDAAIAASETQLAAFDKAAEAQKRLTTDKELKGGTKEVLTAIAQDAGIQGKSELDVLKQKQALEDSIAQKKLEALKAEQTQARVLLELDLRRQQIAVDQSVIAAKQAEIQARQGVSEAEAQLKRAQLTGNPEDIAAAETGLQSAKDTLASARDNSRLAEVGKADFRDLARNAQAAQQIAQESQLSQFNAGEKARRQDQAIALGEAGATGGDIQNAIDKFRQPATAVTALPKFNIESFGADIAQSLKSANQPVVDQLARIGEQLLQAVQTPRSLTVQSPNPVADASKIVNDMATSKARARGI